MEIASGGSPALNPLFVRAGSAFPHKLRREIACSVIAAAGGKCVSLLPAARTSGAASPLGKIFDAEPNLRRGQKARSHTNCGAILGPASSLKKISTPSPLSVRAGSRFIHYLRREIGSSVTLVCPTGIEPAHIRSERIALSTELRTDEGRTAAS